MKFTIGLFLTALLGFAAPLYLPWWSFAVTSFGVALLIPQPPGKSFLVGFCALFVLWGMHTFLIDTMNAHILSEKIAPLLHLGNSGFLLILVTALIGGLISGLAALSGAYATRLKKA
ncbi:MAG: hypothetical protein J0I41_09115 [Filimonas sp.]|nr:hypothetical protein [Filimonas sp.]